MTFEDKKQINELYKIDRDKLLSMEEYKKATYIKKQEFEMALSLRYSFLLNDHPSFRE